jgi:hypothetical protein
VVTIHTHTLQIEQKYTVGKTNKAMVHGGVHGRVAHRRGRGNGEADALLALGAR